MLFNGNLAILHFLSIFHVIKWEFCISSIFHVIQWNLSLRSFSGEGRTDVWTYVRMNGRLEIHPCVLQDIGPLGPLPKKDQSTRATRQLFFGDKQSLLRFVRFLIVFVPWRKKFIPGQIVTNKFWFATHAINTATSIFFKISVPEVKIIPFIQSIISIQYW